MARWWLRSLLFMAILLPLAACQTVTVGGEAFIDRTNAPAHPPRTLAILPLTDASNRPDLAVKLRQALFNASTDLDYQDVDLRQVDARLAALASRMDVSPAQLPSSVAAQPVVADLVLFSHLAHVSRLYLLLYARIKLNVNVALVDTRTRHVLYRNAFVIYDRMGGPTITIAGMLEKLLVGMMSVQPASLEQTLGKAAAEIVRQLPPQQVDRASTNKLRLIDLQVNLPALALRAGQVIGVRAVATSGCRSGFSIGHPERVHRMRESGPGIYEGSYEVQPGDDTPFAVIELSLSTGDGGEKLSYTAAESPFSIDTLPPQRARIRQWWPDETTRKGLFLDMQIEPPRPAETLEAPTRYDLYRRQVESAVEPETAFTLIGTTQNTVFNDQTAVRKHQYEYYIVTEDAAGNRSRPGETTRLDFQ